MAKRAPSLWRTVGGEDFEKLDLDTLALEDVLALPRYTETSDESSGGAVLSARVSARLARAIQVQCQSPDTPYGTTSDWVRDALFVWALLCKLKYFGSRCLSAQRLVEIERLNAELRQCCQIGAEAKEFTAHVLKLAETSLSDAGQFVQRQVWAMAQEADTYHARVYLTALKNANIPMWLGQYLNPAVIKLIEESRPPSANDGD